MSPKADLPARAVTEKTPRPQTSRGLLDKTDGQGTFLVVQWLGLRTPNARDPGSIPGQGTRSPMPELKILCPSMKIKDSECCY